VELIDKGEIDENKSGFVRLTIGSSDRGRYGQREEIRLIMSKVEKQLGRSDGIRSKTPYESQLVPADDSARGRLRTSHIYYNAVNSCIRDAESILIFGPGEAKAS